MADSAQDLVPPGAPAHPLPARHPVPPDPVHSEPAQPDPARPGPSCSDPTRPGPADRSPVFGPAAPRPPARRHPTLRTRLRRLAHPGALARVLFWGLAPFLHATLAALFLGGLAVVVLIWRLQQGPLSLPAVASALESLAAQRGIDLRLAEASIGWAPPDASGLPQLVVGLRGATLPEASGRAQLQLPAAEARLPVAPLLLGAMAPATVTLQAPSLVLELGRAGAASREGTRGTRPDRQTRWTDPLEDLLRPRGPDNILSVLRELRVNAAHLEVRDRHNRSVATFSGGNLDLARAPDGSLNLNGGGLLQVGAASGTLRFSGRAGRAPGGLELNLALPTIRPADLAVALPSLAPLAALDAPVSLDAALRYGAEGATGQARLRVGEGQLSLPDGASATLRGGEAAVITARLDGLGDDLIPWGEVSATLRGGALLLPGTAQITLPLPEEGAAALAPPVAATPRPVSARPATNNAPAGRRTGPAPTSAVPSAATPPPVPVVPPVAAPPVTAPPAGQPPISPAGAMQLTATLLPPTTSGSHPFNLRLDLGAAALKLPGIATLLLGPSNNHLTLTTPDLPDPAAPAGTAVLQLGPGSVRQPDAAPIGVRGISASVAAEAGRVTLRSARLALAAAPPATGGTSAAPVAQAPVIEARGEARSLAEGWRGALDLTVDRVAVADLRRLWPPAVAPGGRDWIVSNITAGTARDGRWHLGGLLPRDGEPRLDALTGMLALDDATVHWLRPIPPLEHVSGTLRFNSPAEMVVEAGGGTQRGTQVALDSLRMRLYDLDTGAEKTELTGGLRGPLRDVLSLVAHPRLDLLRNVPINPAKSGGRAQATLDLRFPLLSDLPAERLDVHVRARVEDGSLGDVVLDQSLRRGRLALDLTQNGMTLDGTGDLGPIRAAKLSASMDFRDGPPGQMLVRARVQGPADLDTLRGSQLDLTDRVGGGAGLDIQLEQRRGGDTLVAVRGDLRNTRLSLAPLNWRKAPGTAGSLDLALRLHGDELRAFDRLHVEAPDLSVEGQVGFAANARTERITIRDARIGDSRLSAELRYPPAPGGLWGVSLRSPLLDLRGMDTGGEGGSDASGSEFPKLDLDAQVDRLLLRGLALDAVRARARQDAEGVLRELRVTASSNGHEALSAEVAPRRGGGRDLMAQAGNLGALLQGAQLTDSIEDGRLEVRGSWPSDRPEAALSGTADLSTFGLRGLGGAGKLLQALSIYGIPEALSGPGLRVSRLHLPFVLTPSVLRLRDARLTSASLGATLTGTLRRATNQAEATGTIIPSYALNSLPGRIPLIGRLFTAEPGGGLLSATFRLHGPVDDPTVTINPLSLLAPGALRGLFGARSGDGNGDGVGVAPALPAAPQAPKQGGQAVPGPSSRAAPVPGTAR